MGGRVAEGGSLENYCTERYRGFESHPIRFQPLLVAAVFVLGRRCDRRLCTPLNGVGFGSARDAANAVFAGRAKI